MSHALSLPQVVHLQEEVVAAMKETDAEFEVLFQHFRKLPNHRLPVRSDLWWMMATSHVATLGRDTTGAAVDQGAAAGHVAEAEAPAALLRRAG